MRAWHLTSVGRVGRACGAVLGASGPARDVLARAQELDVPRVAAVRARSAASAERTECPPQVGTVSG